MSFRDNNRFRKIYPFIRRKPVLIPEGDVIYESGTVTVGVSSPVDTITITFTTTFSSAPSITAVAEADNVNVYIISSTSLEVVLGFSAPYTGKLNYHAIQKNA